VCAHLCRAVRVDAGGAEKRREGNIDGALRAGGGARGPCSVRGAAADLFPVCRGRECPGSPRAVFYVSRAKVVRGVGSRCAGDPAGGVVRRKDGAAHHRRVEERHLVGEVGSEARITPGVEEGVREGAALGAELVPGCSDGGAPAHEVFSSRFSKPTEGTAPPPAAQFRRRGRRGAAGLADAASSAAEALGQERIRQESPLV
jgi:hypothetical protein